MPQVPSTYADSSVTTAPHEHDYVRYACYACLILVLALFAAVRFHFRNVPLERDEGEYAYMGQLILQGVAPFKIAYTMKLPGTALAYAAIMTVLGQTSVAIHIGMILVTTLCAYLLFLLGKKLYGLLAGTIAGITYVFLAIMPGVLGLDGHATHFVVLTALAGILLLLQALQRTRVSLFFVSGLMFGLSFLMKQPGIFFGLFAGCYWLWSEWQRGFSWKALAQRGSAFVLGVALPYAAVCFWIWRAGVFANFWFWTWTYARAYGSIMSLGDSWRLIGRYTVPWALRPIVLWEIALVGLTAPLWSPAARRHGGFLACFFVVSAAAVFPGFYFRPHYFILLQPACALCIGVAVQFAQHEHHRRGFGKLAFVPVLLFSVAYLLSIHGQWKTYFHLDPPALSRKIHSDQPYTEAVTVANFIQARSTPQDQIGIIGSEPEICFYTHLRCATSYLYMYPLMEKQRFAPQMQNEMLEQISTAHPRFLIYEDDERAWGWKYNLPKNLSFFNRAWTQSQANYHLIYEIPVPVPTDCPQGVQTDRKPRLYLFERNRN